MTTTCPNGHESEWPDWCSICGERIAAGEGGETADALPTTAASGDVATETAPETAVGAGPTCTNCGVSRRTDDVFCENCGYDFASGSLPDAMASDAEASAAIAQALHAKVGIDHAFFEASIGDVDLDLPDPAPDPATVPLTGTRILIGRRSNSRGVFPEIDVEALTSDPAVSSRHAILERGPDGTWTLTDLGSTNGTFLTAAASEPIDAGTALPVAAGASIYIGAWTRIDIATTA